MKKEIIIKNPEQMIALGKRIGQHVYANMVIALEGDLGAGKTTLTKGIALGLNIMSVVNSPTFTIMKIYDGRMRLYHLDVYRIDDRDFELQEYFEADGLCVIEWANNIASLLPPQRLEMRITDLGDNQRQIVFEAIGYQYETLLKEITV